jgi:hypothetical protein
MALTTSARIGVALGVGQQRSTNKANVGIDHGMLKGYAERLMHTERRRFVVRDFSGAKRPWVFLNAFTEKKPDRGPRKRNVSRLRRLESKNFWWQNLRHSIRQSLITLQLMTPFRSYNSQLRYGLR